MTADQHPVLLSPAPSPAELSQAIADAVLSVPGVAHLAPTLTDHARRLRTALFHGAAPTFAPGITVELGDAGALVGVDLAVVIDHPSVDTAERVQLAVVDALAHRKLTCASITVAILGMYEEQPAPAAAEGGTD
ncbi:hypothetical protein BKD30_03030 [Tersicoccus phoenicis]|uniref:Asp23/Gls24 family envelope stress response protein n=1 Tax=Tersicoccus phoenicis TaxID=554083 RepID=A0A1R1LJB5_9MICC|nr:hypothetical protein [Tersicoccus phoenicis]OMH27635.1 hypothetical protein BKD30_03030 [Tersicoccus phoenicis]